MYGFAPQKNLKLFEPFTMILEFVKSNKILHSKISLIFHDRKLEIERNLLILMKDTYEGQPLVSILILEALPLRVGQTRPHYDHFYSALTF